MTVAAGTDCEGIASARAVIRKAIESYEVGGTQIVERERRARESVSSRRMSSRKPYARDDKETDKIDVRSWVQSVVDDDARPEKQSAGVVVRDVITIEGWWRMLLAMRARNAMQAQRLRKIARVHRIVIDKVHAWGGIEFLALFYVRADPECSSCQSVTNVGVCVATAMEAYHHITLSAIRGMEEAGIRLANYGGEGADEPEQYHRRSRSARLSVAGGPK